MDRMDGMDEDGRAQTDTEGGKDGMMKGIEQEAGGWSF
jgi:hypothetical protein